MTKNDKTLAQGSSKAKTKANRLVNNLSRLFQTQESDRAYDVSQSDCLILLQAMELDDKFENDVGLMEEEEQGEEEEMVNLPDDWIFNLQ